MNVGQLRHQLVEAVKALHDVDDDVEVLGDYSQAGGYGAEPESARKLSVSVWDEAVCINLETD